MDRVLGSQSTGAAIGPQRGLFDETVRRAAASNCTILVTGETGSGKGHLARRLHESSRRATAPFVPVNCGAIPPDLIDSHLFGHTRGAFTGAAVDHQGLVRAADGGTLLLDEVGELPLAAQTRLLRLLDEGEVQPVGSAKPLRVSLRIIAATNVDLEEAVEAGRFREDLFFRLDVVRIAVPPLRSRRDAIAVLLHAFSGDFAAAYERPEFEFERAAIRMLEAHPWPGNIRQLRSVIERLYVLCPDRRVGVEALRSYAQLAPVAPSASMRLGSAKSMRRDLASEALAACAGNMSRAAAELGVHRSTLYRWLQAS